MANVLRLSEEIRTYFPVAAMLKYAEPSSPSLCGSLLHSYLRDMEEPKRLHFQQHLLDNRELCHKYKIYC